MVGPGASGWTIVRSISVPEAPGRSRGGTARLPVGSRSATTCLCRPQPTRQQLGLRSAVCDGSPVVWTPPLLESLPVLRFDVGAAQSRLDLFDGHLTNLHLVESLNCGVFAPDLVDLIEQAGGQNRVTRSLARGQVDLLVVDPQTMPRARSTPELLRQMKPPTKIAMSLRGA